jgi:hypothetical protein
MSPLFIAVVACAGISLFAGQRWLDRHKPRKKDPLLTLRPPRLTSREGRDFVASVLAAADAGSTHWPPDEVRAARDELWQRYGVVPGREYLASRYPPMEAEAAIRQALEARARVNDGLRQLATIAIRPGVCHLCGRPSAMTYPFGLASVRHQETDASATVVTLLLSAVLGPLIGLVAVYGASRRMSGKLLRLDLQVCPECDRERKGRLRFGKVTEWHWAHHPWWAAAHQAGYTTFVSEADLGKWHQSA